MKGDWVLGSMKLLWGVKGIVSEPWAQARVPKGVESEYVDRNVI